MGASGNVTMTFAPLASMGVLDVVVTKQDRQPYIGAVQVISTNAPFITAISYQIDDAARITINSLILTNNFIWT